MKKDSQIKFNVIGKQIKFTILGKPQALKRARHVFKNGKSYCYDSQKEQKRADRVQISSQMSDQGVIRKLDGHLNVKLIFHMGGAGNVKTEHLNGLPFDRTPIDIDNMIKFYLDTMNDLVYIDDRQVTNIEAEKIYSDDKRVEIFINKIEM